LNPDGSRVLKPDLLDVLGAPDTRASLSWDGETMDFGSARSGGEGSADIYVTRRDRTNGKFGKVVSFPPPTR
jgi:uncharacterized protein YbaR (Trm112 family)